MNGGSALGEPFSFNRLTQARRVLPVHRRIIELPTQLFAAKALSLRCLVAITASVLTLPTYGQNLSFPDSQSLEIDASAQLALNAANSVGTSPAGEAPQLRKLSVPGPHVRSIATALNLKYRDMPGVMISPDANNQQLIVMAPPKVQSVIASEANALLQGSVQQGAVAGPLQRRLQNTTWREFERDLKQAVGQDVPVTTREGGNLVTFQINVAPMQGTSVEVDRRQNLVTVRSPGPAVAGWRKMLEAMDSVPNRYDDITRVHRLKNAEMAPVQRTFRLLGNLPKTSGGNQRKGSSVFRSAVFQAAQGAGQAAGQGGDQGEVEVQVDPQGGDVVQESGGPLGDVQIRYVPNSVRSSFEERPAM